MLKISKFNYILGFNYQYSNRNLSNNSETPSFIDCTGPLNYMKTLRSVKNELLFIQVFKKDHSWKKWNRTKQLKFPNNNLPQNLIMVRYRR